MVAHTSQLTFDQDVLQASVPVVLDFYATWCPPCRILAPILDQLAREFGDRVKFFKVNTDEEPHLAARFQIQGVPTLILLQQGRIVDTMVGAPTAAVLQQKIAHMAMDASNRRR